MNIVMYVFFCSQVIQHPTANEFTNGFTLHPLKYVFFANFLTIENVDKKVMCTM